MKYLIILFLLVGLSGCAWMEKLVPAGKPKWPEASPELMKKCEDLKQIIGDRVTIQDMLNTVVQNYTMYYQCANKVDGWQKWYENQKKIYEGTKK